MNRFVRSIFLLLALSAVGGVVNTGIAMAQSYQGCVHGSDHEGNHHDEVCDDEGFS